MANTLMPKMTQQQIEDMLNNPIFTPSPFLEAVRVHQAKGRTPSPGQKLYFQKDRFTLEDQPAPEPENPYKDNPLYGKWG